MSFRNQEISFIEGIKDRIANVFKNAINNRRVEILVFQVIVALLWWGVLSLSQLSMNVLAWPIHIRLLLNLGWIYLFIMLFLGMFVGTITVRTLLDYLFFPLEFFINLLIETLKNWVAQFVRNFISWFIHFIWNNIVTKVILIGLGIIVLGILVSGITISGILLLVLGIAIILAITVAVGYAYYKHYEGETKEIINDLLCNLRELITSIKSIPSGIINTLKFFILDQMKTISDDKRVQALVFQLTLLFISYGVFVYLTGVYDPNSWPIYFFIPWGAFFGLQVLIVIFIWWPKGTYSFERMLTFFLKPLYWLILPIEWFLEWIESLIPCNKANRLRV